MADDVAGRPRLAEASSNNRPSESGEQDVVAPESPPLPHRLLRQGSDAAQAEGDASSGSGGVLPPPMPATTLVVRNVPRRYTLQMLMDVWPSNGTYDFLCLPCIRRGSIEQNQTYAFINFVTESEAIAFRNAWHMRHLAEHHTGMALHISAAQVQGLKANIQEVALSMGKLEPRRRRPPFIMLDGRLASFEEACRHVGGASISAGVASSSEPDGQSVGG